MINKYYQKKQRKASKRCTREVPKYHQNRNKNHSEEEKLKKVEYMRNYYLAHKK